MNRPVIFFHSSKRNRFVRKTRLFYEIPGKAQIRGKFFVNTEYRLTISEIGSEVKLLLLNIC